MYKTLFPHGSKLTELVHHIFDTSGKKLSIDKLLQGSMKDVWSKALDNEFGRLSNGIPNELLGTKTIGFILKKDIPFGRKITYANMVCDFKPLKDEKYRVRLTIGGDKLEYIYDTAAPAANLLEPKLLLNSVISDCKEGARFMTIDILNFFLQSILNEREYMKIHSRYFSKKFKNYTN